MLEQVCGLSVDLERVLLIEQVGVEPFFGHPTTVLQPNTIVEIELCRSKFDFACSERCAKFWNLCRSVIRPGLRHVVVLVDEVAQGGMSPGPVGVEVGDGPNRQRHQRITTTPPDTRIELSSGTSRDRPLEGPALPYA